MNIILIGTSIFFVLAAIVIFLVFLRPAVETTASGTILSLSSKAADTYVQHQSGGSRGFRTPTEIAIAEATILEIKLDDRADPIRYSVNTLAGEEFEVGQRVSVNTQERGFKPIWHRVYVMDVVLLE